MWIRWALVALVLCSVAGVASAQAVDPGKAWNRPYPVGYFAREARPSAAEIRMLAGASGGGGAAVRWAIRAGRFMPYVGTGLMVWSVVDAALARNASLANPATSGNFKIDCYYGWITDGCTLPPAHAPGVLPGPGETVWWYGSESAYQFGDHERLVNFRVFRPGTGVERYSVNRGVPSTNCRNVESALSGNVPTHEGVLQIWDVFAGRVNNCVTGATPREVIADPSEVSGTNDPARWAQRITDAHITEEVYSPGFPDTYGSPYPGLTITPAPNMNQWFDNPYADPQSDTDGDGVPDWQEHEAGTDPNDPASTPTAPVVPPRPQPGDPGYSPVTDPTHPDYDPSQDPQRDSDGDGIPDVNDPCPHDALNRCADVDPRDIPASEPTLEEIRDLLEEIRDQGAQEQEEQEEEEEEDVSPMDFGPISVALPEWSPGQITTDMFSSVGTAFQASLDTAIAGSEGKLPFLTGGWVPIVSLSGGSTPCAAIPMSILGHVQDVGVCETPVHTILATTARLALLGLMVVGFWLAMTKWVTTS